MDIHFSIFCRRLLVHTYFIDKPIPVFMATSLVSMFANRVVVVVVIIINVLNMSHHAVCYKYK